MRVLMVGAFPPPLHGMAAVNVAVREALEKVGVNLTVIKVGGKTLQRSFIARSRRLPLVLSGLMRMLLSRKLRGASFYMSISGGGGQVYDCCFLALARLKGARPFLHHHSFSYLRGARWLTNMLVRIGGGASVHITQSEGMADRLRMLYPSAQRVIPVSNAVFLVSGCQSQRSIRSSVRTLGFISNIAPEKGIFDFLDLVAACEKAGLPIKARLAGPLQDADVEKAVRQRLAETPSVEYIGPQFGADKDAFLSTIDVLIFPTRYKNETEGIVNHEAMCRGIPVIAFGRGCIPEIIDGESGLVIDPAGDFVDAALSKIREWLSNPEAYETASRAASERFSATLSENVGRWEKVFDGLVKSRETA